MGERGASRALVALLLLAGCRDWRARVDPAKAAGEPEQVAIPDGTPVELELKGFQVRLTPRATYRITGLFQKALPSLLISPKFGRFRR